MESDEDFFETNPHFEDNEDFEEEDQDIKNKSLLEKVKNLNEVSFKKRKVRTEPRAIHELNLVSDEKKKVNLKQLLDKIKGSSNTELVDSIKKFTKKASRKKLLDAPLETIHKNRLERKVLFKDVSKEVSKWEPIVLRNRVADQLSFPLKEPETKLESSEEVKKKFKPKNDFEIEIHELLASSENYLNDDQPLTEAEEKALRSVSLEEAKAKHRELRRQRALLSYQEAKLNRQNKIKSKSYRRLKKREKLKKTLKEFEELKKNDPQKALEKLKDIEKIRIQERTSLKHLNTGKWAKFNKIRAKNDKDIREKLAEQISLNKQLVEKLYEESEEEIISDNESDDQIEPDCLLQKDINANEEHCINETLSSKVEETGNQVFQSNLDNLIEKMNVEELEEMMIKKKKKKKRKGLLNEKISEIKNDEDFDSDDNEIASELDVDEDNYRKLISEALAEDDAVEDFKNEKQNLLDEQKKELIQDNFLPGWGSWAGTGIKIGKKRRKRFVKRAPDVIRKDKNLSNVIISEKNSASFQKFLPKSLPPGVSDMKEYKKKITKPIGSNWNPETVFKTLTEPKVLTKLGKIIDPMDQDALMKSRKISQRKNLKSEKLLSLE